MLVLLMPFLSSTGCSLFWKKLFLADCPIGFSSLLQGNPRGRVVTLLINFGVISMERPRKVTVAWVLDWGTKERANSWAISSSNPQNFSKKVIQVALVNMAITWGCSWILVELEGSFLMNPPIIVLIPLLNTKCRDGDKNFEKKKENRGQLCLLKNR